VAVNRIGEGPLFDADGSAGKRLVRRIRNITIETLSFVLLTVLFPLLLLIASLVDFSLWLRRRKPWVGVRLLAYFWWFLFGEMRALVTVLFIWVLSGGPFGHGSMRRRKWVYELRIRWARSHLGGIKVLFGLGFEVEGLEEASRGPILVMMRHASIIDNTLPDSVIGHAHGIGLRYVIKRELQAIPTIDIAGRWVSTIFVRRASGDTEGETAIMRSLAEDMGAGEGLMIYPEGTRFNAKKLERAKQVIAERQPEISPLADQLEHLLPPRLGGPLTLIDAAPGVDVVICGHVGFDGLQHVSDIWAGKLVGGTIRVRLQRFAAAEIPSDEAGRVAWLYERWIELDGWIGAQLAPTSPL
jgi:1-acyl-sn-glycerol-3-phosphate acyltransferase